MDGPKKLNQNKWTTTSTKIEWEVLEKVKNQKRKAENQKKKTEGEKKHMSNIKDKKKKKKKPKKKKGKKWPKKKTQIRNTLWAMHKRSHGLFGHSLLFRVFSSIFSLIWRDSILVVGEDTRALLILSS